MDTAQLFANLLQAERNYEDQLFSMLNSLNDHSFERICEAYKALYAVVELIVPRDFNNAKEHEDRLWNAHHLGQKRFHAALKILRKNNPANSVETRAFVKNYMVWLKQSERFYRSYIAMLSLAVGGIPELEVIAHTTGPNGVRAAAPQIQVTPSHHDKILGSCHRALISLGDLSRYRASEKLDKEPDFGPALGYYGLASTLMPSNGLGHHQQAVVALAQNNHLRAIYHLYRSMTVPDAHPLAAGNLRLEMDKTVAAFNKGELIERRAPRDPEAPKLALVGWFVRLHSLCYSGKAFGAREYEELEQEVLSQLTSVLKQRALDGTLSRMILVNLAAQNVAGRQFQADSSLQNQQSFLLYFRLNLKTFTALLSLFCNDLRSFLVGKVNHDSPLVSKLTEIGRRLLPYLRIYSNWLRFDETIPMIDGFMSNPAIDEAISDAATKFWPLYARAIDLVTQAFPVWELEEQTKEIPYMLEEDVDTFQFLPLTDESTLGTWYDKAGTAKPRFSDRLTHLSSDEEMLWRIKEFQATGLYLALEVDLAPLSLSAKNRVYFGDSNNIEPLTVPEKVYEKPKPVSYANVAARPARHLTVGKTPAQESQAARMVASLVDDDDFAPGADDDQPITPPQPAAATPWSKGGDEQPEMRSSVDLNGMTSPLLFGGGGGLWSAGYGG